MRLSLFLGSLLPLLAAPLSAQDTKLAALPAGDPPARVARISSLAGNVAFQPSGDTAWSQATLNYPMTTGDRLYVDRGGRAELQAGSAAVRLDEGADLTVSNLTDGFLELGLMQGTARVNVYRLDPGDSVEVDTPHGVLTVLAAGDYRIDAPADDTALVVTVARGSLEWTAGGVAQAVEAGQAIRVTGVNPIRVTNVAPAGPDAFDQWCAAQEGRLAASPSARYVSRDIPGYADLDDAGTWQDDAEYGPVWYPAGLATDWAPYRYGHWAWIEPWGWTWVEREPWGYAPFHYGRWVYARSRWGWLPGPVVLRPYYAPALVVFVSGSQWGAQAWFPLGPGEPYYPWYHHDDDYLRRVNVTNLRHVTNVTTIINNTNITTINYRNRQPGTTAVPSSTFQRGLGVQRRMIPVRAEEIARAPIVAHPVALPAASAAGGGTPVSRPLAMRRPVFFTARPPEVRLAARPGQPLVVPRRNQPAAGPAPVLITRHAPPPQDPPFADRQRAMKPDVGRPLEPQQIDNLRAGKPAGPRRDPEYPPHPAPAPAAAPRPAPTPAAAPRPAAAPHAPAPKPAPRQPAPKDDRRRGPGN